MNSLKKIIILLLFCSAGSLFSEPNRNLLENTGTSYLTALLVSTPKEPKGVLAVGYILTQHGMLYESIDAENKKILFGGELEVVNGKVTRVKEIAGITQDSPELCESGVGVESGLGIYFLMRYFDKNPDIFNKYFKNAQFMRYDQNNKHIHPALGSMKAFRHDIREVLGFSDQLRYFEPEQMDVEFILSIRENFVKRIENFLKMVNENLKPILPEIFNSKEWLDIENDLKQIKSAWSNPSINMMELYFKNNRLEQAEELRKDLLPHLLGAKGVSLLDVFIEKNRCIYMVPQGRRAKSDFLEIIDDIRKEKSYSKSFDKIVQLEATVTDPDIKPNRYQTVALEMMGTIVREKPYNTFIKRVNSITPTLEFGRIFKEGISEKALNKLIKEFNNSEEPNLRPYYRVFFGTEEMSKQDGLFFLIESKISEMQESGLDTQEMLNLYNNLRIYVAYYLNEQDIGHNYSRLPTLGIQELLNASKFENMSLDRLVTESHKFSSFLKIEPANFKIKLIKIKTSLPTR